MIFNPKNKIVKPIAIIVCVCFLWQDAGWAGSQDFLRQRQFYAEGEAEAPAAGLDSLAAFGMPVRSLLDKIPQELDALLDKPVKVALWVADHDETLNVTGAGRLRKDILNLIYGSLTRTNALWLIFTGSAVNERLYDGSLSESDIDWRTLKPLEDRFTRQKQLKPLSRLVVLGAIGQQIIGHDEKGRRRYIEYKGAKVFTRPHQLYIMQIWLRHFIKQYSNVYLKEDEIAKLGLGELKDSVDNAGSPKELEAIAAEIKNKFNLSRFEIVRRGVNPDSRRFDPDFAGTIVFHMPSDSSLEPIARSFIDVFNGCALSEVSTGVKPVINGGHYVTVTLYSKDEELRRIYPEITEGLPEDGIIAMLGDNPDADTFFRLNSSDFERPILKFLLDNKKADSYPELLVSHRNYVDGAKEIINILLKAEREKITYHGLAVFSGPNGYFSIADIEKETGVKWEELRTASRGATAGAMGRATAANSSGGQGELVVEGKEKRLKTILWARGYSVENERELGLAIKKELEAQERLFANTLIPVEIKNSYTTIIIQREMPSAKAISRNENVTVNVFQNRRLIDPGKALARMVYADFIRWALWEKGFHGNDKNISFDTYHIPNYRGIYLFRDGPLVNLPAYVKLLIREKLKKQGILDKGRVLLETERALNMIAEWFLEHEQGTDYGLKLAALYVGVPAKDRKAYIAAAKRIAETSEADAKGKTSTYRFAPWQDKTVDGAEVSESDTSLLTRTEETNLARQIRQGNKEARDRFIAANIRLVVAVAKRYESLGLTVDDLVSEGTIGLIRAVDKFDPERGCKFSTYATWWINQAVRRAIANAGRQGIVLPVHVEDNINRLKKNIAKLRIELQREPTDKEIASEAGLTLEEVLEIKSIRHCFDNIISLDAPAGTAENSNEMIDFVADAQSQTDMQYIESTLAQGALWSQIKKAKVLTERETEILAMRWGLDGHRPHILEEVGRQFNLTRERIRQIEFKAIRKIQSFYKTEAASATGAISLTQLKELKKYDDSIIKDTRLIRKIIGRRFMKARLLEGARENLRKRLAWYGYARKSDLSACVSAVDKILSTWHFLKQYEKNSLNSLKNVANRVASKIDKIQAALEDYGIAQKTDYETQHLRLFVFDVCLRLEKTAEETDVQLRPLRARLSGIAADMRKWLNSQDKFPEAEFLAHARAIAAISKEKGVGNITSARLAELAKRLEDLIKMHELIMAIEGLESLEPADLQQDLAPEERAVALGTSL